MNPKSAPDPRNRIVRHVRVRAGDLVPHELNARRHPQAQRQALLALYAEVGFARSLLAYELPDGRLKLIDGHLRQSMDPGMEVDVEVLDVSDAEARALLLAIDPLAELARYDNDIVNALREVVEKDSAAVRDIWQALENEAPPDEAPADPVELKDQYLVVIECEDEKEQVELLRRFQREGLRARRRSRE